MQMKYSNMQINALFRLSDRWRHPGGPRRASRLSVRAPITWLCSDINNSPIDRYHESTRNYGCMESQDRKTSLQSHRMDRLPNQKHGRPFWAKAYDDWYTSLSWCVEEGAKRNRYPTQHVCLLCYIFELIMMALSLIALGFHCRLISLLSNCAGWSIITPKWKRHINQMIFCLERLNRGSHMFVYSFSPVDTISLITY